MQRSQPPKSGPKRVLEGMTGALPGRTKAGAGAKATGKSRRGGKAGGVALVGAAAGLLFRNRGRLTSMLGRDGSRTDSDAGKPMDTTSPADTSPVEAGTRPAEGATDPARRGDIAPTDPGLRPDIPPAG